MKDIIIVDGNEKEFIQQAKVLGFKELIMLYPIVAYDSVNIEEIQKETKVKLTKGILAKKDEIRAAKKLELNGV